MKKQQPARAVIFALCVAFLLVGLAGPAYAADFGGFSAKAVIPDNQLDESLTYFDLRVQPGQSQTVQIMVRNGSDKPIVAEVSLDAAATGRGGVIVYNRPDNRDASLEIAITDIARVVNPQVVIPANEDAFVDVEIQLPAEAFDGVILGGLTVTAAEQNPDNASEASGTSISNEYAYIIGLKLTENDSAVEPELHLKSITPGLVNYRTAVFVNLQNSEPLIMKEIEITARVYKLGSQDVLQEMSKSRAEMAPNSNCDFVIEWQNKPIEPGDYRLRMTARYEGRLWEWDEEFTIQADDANEANENAVNLPPKGLPAWAIILIVLLILAIVAIVAYLLGRRMTKHGRNAE